MDKKWLARLLITLVTTLPVVQAEELFPDYIDTGNGIRDFHAVVVPSSKRSV